MTGHACPECGRRTAGEPGTEHRMPCRCGTDTGAQPLTGDELRAARSAEMAAAEDFDPLRIRPYVTLGEGTGPEGGDALEGPVRDPSAGPAQLASGDAATTMPLHLGGGVDSRTGVGTGSGFGTGSESGAGPAFGTGPESGAGPAFGTGPESGAGPAFGTGPESGAGPAFGTGPESGAGPAFGTGSESGAGPAFGTGPAFGAASGVRTTAPLEAPDPVQPRRRRPFAALAVGAAVVAVVGTAAFAGGLFDRDGAQSEALPEATTSAPDTADEPAASVAPAPSPSASAAPSRTASPSSTPSASASASPSASPSTSESAEPSATASAPATASPDAPSASATREAAPPTDAPPAELAPSSLRRGDQGPQVAVLQNRLQEVWLYHGDADGNFNDRVEHAVRIYQSYKAIEGDAAGVYGPNTRSALEAETSGRGRG
ncbi:peptidoglycan-binding domain-containing protein [Streptomyces sp. CA-146814]|uniref:peptidoglycan-binding domain-containing protein n=1 Tax=Streptomyces sp. CA-146814 TaxID=3240053 RepID=UPI003D89F98F